MNPVVPAEWAPHSTMWVGFPSHPDLWEDDHPKDALLAVRAWLDAGPDPAPPLSP